MPSIIMGSWSASLFSSLDQSTTLPAGQIRWTDSDWSLTQYGSRTDTEFRLQFWDQALAQINPEKKTIRMHALSADTTQATLEHLLYDQVFPRVLGQEGLLILHSGAVQIEGNLALFLGKSGMGKSTMVASLYQAGATLLGDDALLITADAQGFTGQELYRGLRLLPDSMSRLFPQQPKTTQMAHYSLKQRLNVSVAATDDSAPKPVGALFFLAPARGDAEVTLRRMSAAETCMGIITNSFSLDPTDPLLARQKLQQAAALANGVAAFELSYPRDYAVLPQVHEKIRKQMTMCCSQGGEPKSVSAVRG
ncbi:hypothetical protein [Pseudomonas sp. N040]|uniref:hypothetical protein n=1 Tax=Pseudomonas sp. N040 TaxID=2785325 RepID=UPI0018A281F0|nr:hypothetical protein [Pseudomonas sp. N040]MBF7728668.1 hypothetical protein [Pseudomonas sp. N040]MBW7012308.1 hypothetical protein [Pseudomonas sp. N040]